MCGRYSLYGPFQRRDPEWVEFWAGIVEAGLSGTARYNIAPTQIVPILTADEAGVTLRDVRWGLIPGWAKDAKIAASCINARSESVAEKPAFRNAWRTGRRCLVPATAWYEWRGEGGIRQPYRIAPVDGANPSMIAGLWERWRAPDGALLDTCAVLTRDAQGHAARVHDRMPLVLPIESWRDWLAGPTAQAEALLHVAPIPLRFDAVGTAVNAAKNEGAALVEPVEAELRWASGE